MAQQLQVCVLSKRATRHVHAKRSEGWAIIDVTSKSSDETWRKFSPFYPIGGLHVPGQPAGTTSASVEGAWQGLKVFEGEGVDVEKMAVRTLKNLKRSSKAKGRGRVLGHAFQNDIIGYIEARRRIYLPLYDQVLTRLAPELDALRALAMEHGGRIVLIDYETNADVDDPSRPLSHASLVAAALLR